MGLIASTFSHLSARRWKRFDRQSADPETAQRLVLRHLLARASNTRWGRQRRLGEIATVEQFRRRVGLIEYQAAAELWHEAFTGKRDVTWPGHVKYFALSSGTTAGNKLLPVTADAVASNLRAGAILAACLARRGGAENLVGGKFLYLGGSTTLRQKGPCLIGDASGIVARHIPFYAKARRLPGPAIAALTNWEQKIDRIVEDYLTADVCGIGACPSWAALLFKQLQHAADDRGLHKRAIGELWPRLSHVVSYGMAFEPYRGAFEEYIGRAVHYVDTYSSSETGMTAIQDEPGGPMRMIVDNGVFYEFVPADRAGESDPPRLHVGEVELGRDYALVVSTNGGIWAYPLGDVVRFVSLRPPRIVFVGRTQVALSAFGEHVTLDMIETAVASACRACNALVADYTVAPRYPTPSQPRPGHRWLMEFDRPPADPAAFIAAIDTSIRARNEDYDTHRTDNFGLEPPILIPLAPGTFYAWMKQKGKLGGQHKVPRVARTAETPDELLALSSALRPPA